MTILCDTDLLAMLPGLIHNYDESLVNPASIDIRIGHNLMREDSFGRGFIKTEIPQGGGYYLQPGEFVLIETMEHFIVPNGYAMDLRLKSSTARRGFDHSLAFWVDPGWKGVLTMEIRNVLAFNPLLLIPGQRFAQVIVHKLSGLSSKPYEGKYKDAKEVEEAKP